MGNVLSIIGSISTDVTTINNAKHKRGNIDDKLRANKIYKCKSCDLIMDRVLYAARNMLLKFIIEQSTERAEVHSSALRSLRLMKCLTSKEL
jgi:hypothetical protein